ncbi:hypothetical protein EDD16DRAFT_105999 [Pisolithus croceorrhizus]|nr:hypothetical protein EDD16DRAFT_105999 [Pisolithus croceorrhizus]
MGIPGGFGATLIAGMASAMLYGITTLQGLMCITCTTLRIPRLFDTLHVSFMCYTLYYYLITNYGDLLSLEYVVWSFPLSLTANLFVITMVQLFFAHKIYHLCRRKVRWMVTAPIVLLVLAHLGFGVVTVVMVYSGLSNHFTTILISVCRLVNSQASAVSRARFRTKTTGKTLMKNHEKKSRDP